ncbi:NAD(P)-dependent alcohol dehydrogenase [Gilliamella sp. B3023]|uniref:NAD(P)-dependent alcohol dehydrogenase n=1 Tax=unclassified Gilliamella TaxID=2685620 RepID=UPI00226ACD4F|nr:MULTISPECIES: NAD(P)-dependent alcohol dehydrogenase [unclassified Gilliamella]MCX8585591.1 NAD(P)-dependent alcohol dehydrogenase [Gilliamella sp. B3562]MCX8674312.1 NAD(P)-dependent alcohol dehydrogenase [Gilliamella sp. B3023]MCX8685502.1 NAD(P)-dependent alcohol dehydrogenase [Gilliamella sp. B2864]
MKNTAAILEKPGKMVIKDTDIPIPKDDEILLEVKYVGICGSDVHGFEHGPFIPPKDPNQVIGLGHECSGIIKKVGKNVTKFKVGQRVCIEPGVPCYQCEFCLSGHYNVCPNVDFMATQPNYRGALTNYLTHPEAMTFHLPQNMSLIEGALVEPAAVGIHAAKMAGDLLGKSVVILGSGCIGLMTLQACKLKGAARIVVIDILDNRLNKAKELGATDILRGDDNQLVEKVRNIVGEYGADIVFETAGTAFTASKALELVKRRGHIFIVGSIPGGVPVEFLKINREVSIQTVFRYANDFNTTIDSIASGKFDVNSIVDRFFEYQDTQKAFEFSVHHKKELIKGVIKVAD